MTAPNPFWTPKILDILDGYDIKANFFVLGKYAEKYKEIVKDVFNRGHLIGNHTYFHPREGNGDFDKAEEIIVDIIREHTKFIRPPYLNISLCNNYAPAAEERIKIITCDVFPGDYYKNSEDIKKDIIEKTRNGSIITLHDGSQKEEQLENRPKEMFAVLPIVIRDLKKKFKIARLDEMEF